MYFNYLRAAKLELTAEAIAFASALYRFAPTLPAAKLREEILTKYTSMPKINANELAFISRQYKYCSIMALILYSHTLLAESKPVFP